MREKKSFAERAKILTSDEARKRYFLVYEGKDTELLYFDAVNELRDVLRLDPLLELVPIVRSYSEEGWSNPKKIVERMIQNIEENKSGVISYETLLNWLMEYLQDKGYIANNRPLAKNMWRILTWICQEKLGVSLNTVVEEMQEACEQIISMLEKETGIENLMKDVTRIINYGNITFAEGLDKVCFIVDRDRKSFTVSQYDYVLRECEKRGFGLYLTNPCFEFWLLMHFDDVHMLDKKQLLENPMVTSGRRYTENELRKRISGYRKSKYDAMELVRDIDTAIENEKRFCENIEKLESTLGSNVGMLIGEMRGKG